MNILIVEDEFITGATLQTALERIGYDVSGHAMSAAEAIVILKEKPVDLAILDINIKGDKSGIWLGQFIQKHYDLPFIYLTAYGDEATVKKALETRPCGYLMKPFETVDIYTAIETGLINYASRGQKKVVNPQSLTSKDSLFLKEDHLFIKIRFDDIRYVRAAGNYLELQLAEKKHLIRSSMKEFIQQLPSQQFLRIHKSFLINLEKVTEVGPNFVHIGTESLPFTMNVKSELMRRLGIG